ncbi:MAG: ZIP family metal transporter [Tissierellia bacterium]|nr:ZIP family metal transporter [Tissierellia bacterium]
MDYILYVTLIGFLVGVIGTGLGGVLSLFIKNTNRIMSFLLGLTGGFMLFIVTFHLLPESYYVSGSHAITVLGIAIGIIMILFIENHIDRLAKNPYIKSSLLLGISIAAHNFPEGLALGSSFLTMSNLGPTLALAMMIHDIPEGIAMAIPMKINREPRLKIVLLTLLIGIPTGIGAFLGAYLGTFSPSIIALCLSFAGGTMLYIICDEIIPSAKSLHKGRASSFGIVLGFIAGILMYIK